MDVHMYVCTYTPAEYENWRVSFSNMQICKDSNPNMQLYFYTDQQGIKMKTKTLKAILFATFSLMYICMYIYTPAEYSVRKLERFFFEYANIYIHIYIYICKDSNRNMQPYFYTDQQGV